MRNRQREGKRLADPGATARSQSFFDAFSFSVARKMPPSFATT
jgi:hypothetical protein